MKVITVVSETNNKGHEHLVRSLKYHGYDLDVMIHPFKFGGQMEHVYNWCKSNWGIFLYTDGWDTFALAPPEEVLAKFEAMQCKILISAEKNCYPLKETAALYPPCPWEWKYVNGGGFMGDCEMFCEMYEDGTIDKVHERNDQQWLAEEYCARYYDEKVKLDTRCEIFQTIAFEGTEDFSRYAQGSDKHDGNWPDRLRLMNNKTNSFPVFIHGNAHTRMDKIWQML